VNAVAIPQAVKRTKPLRASQKRRLRRELLAGRPWVECHYCGEHLTEATMTLDHVKPVALGGRNALRNFVPACKTCNLMKANIPYPVFLRQVMRIAA
jgi:5-methylcytosine-specific restriction endonuclease McrA